jgi:hypothetical protein
MPRALRDNGLGIAFGLLFLATLFAQSVAGHRLFNEDQLAHHEEAISYGRYLTSSSFGQAVMENWQSEYLQFTLYILGTVWLVQRGSPESKELDKAGGESDQQQKIGQHASSSSPLWAKAGGLRTKIYSNSLVLLMGFIFFASWFGSAATGWTEYNADQDEHKQPIVSLGGYMKSADFWESSLQNWQSEFLAIGSMAVFSIYLRQRGSPESKPVGASHSATGAEG